MTDSINSCKDAPNGCHDFTTATPCAPIRMITAATVCRWCGLPAPPILSRITPVGWNVPLDDPDGHLGAIE